MKLDWKLADHKVVAANRLRVDQLEFGPVVDPKPEGAETWPLGLAVAILSDRNGLIDLDLPMTGNLDDPEFAWGGLVWQTFKNLMVKVATAPFSLVAGLFSGQDPEALRSVAFAPGEASAQGDEAAKLETFVTMLTERPLLKLELHPGIDPVKDRDDLARRLLHTVMDTRKAASPEALDDAQLITAAWRRLVGPEAPAVPLEKMEVELVAKQVVTDEALALLRRDRANWMKESLAEKGIDVARLFVLGTADNASATIGVGLK